MDENKVTHVSEYVIIGVIDTTKKSFGVLFLSFRKKHTFLGMEIELVKDGKIKIFMKSYKKEPIEKIG